MVSLFPFLIYFPIQKNRFLSITVYILSPSDMFSKGCRGKTRKIGRVERRALCGWFFSQVDGCYLNSELEIHPVEEPITISLEACKCMEFNSYWLM